MNNIEKTTIHFEVTAWVTGNTWLGNNNRIWLKIAPVIVTGARRSATVYALFDEGSTVTMTDADLVEEIWVSSPPNPLHLHGLNGMSSSDASTQVVEVEN